MVDLDRHRYPVHYLDNIKNFCMKIVSFVDFYKKQTDYYKQNITFYFNKRNSFDSSKFSKKNGKEKRGVIISLLTVYIALAYKGISSYLHNKRQTALEKAFATMKNQVNLENSKIFHLKDSMVMHGIYYSDTLEEIIKQLGMKNSFCVSLINGIDGLFKIALYIML